MIAKNLILLLLFIILPDVYLYWRYLRKKRLWYALPWFLPCLFFIAATVFFSREKDFVPDDMTWLNVYLFLLVLIVGGKFLFSIASLCGRNGWKIGIGVVLLEWAALFYGSFIGPRQLEVRHVDLTFSDLPQAFDGYRMVHFSDLHLGSTDMDFVCQLVDSINMQRADVVLFTGDLQNKIPTEVTPYVDALSAIDAKDGVFSVQGNHDYAEYMDAPYYVKAMSEEMLVGNEFNMGWTVLANDHQIIRRGNEPIFIAGMENDGEGRFPQKGNVNAALWGLSRNNFVIMLEHDPSSWRRKILRHCHAQLTLSGHTHGMQFQLFGWSPLSLFKHEVDGLYQMGERFIYVSKGAGALLPFRFCCNPEIVVITLHCNQSNS